VRRLDVAAGVAGVLALVFCFSVASGMLTGWAKLAFWAPLTGFVVLMVLGMALERNRR
jgi:hypothetical protein